MKISKYPVYGVLALAALGAVSCTDDLNVEPDDPNTIMKIKDAEMLYSEFASVYNDLVTGEGVAVSDGGAGSWTRCHFNLQELPTDECFISYKWNDPGYEVLNFATWNNNNEWIYAAYTRENHLAKIASGFIKDMNDYGEALIPDEAERKSMIAEARVLRAFANYTLIDLFGKGPWITEDSPTGVAPETYDRKQIFEGTVADLKACLEDLKPAAQQVYGRLSKEAGYMLLAKLYLNAEVYVGTPMYQECADALKHVCETGISLAPTYKYLFCADNDRYVGKGEIIWGVPSQQNQTETYGSTTYLTAAAWIESADPAELHRLNANGNWSGLRLRPEVSRSTKGDPRRLIYEGTYQEDIPDLSAYDATSCGYMLVKFTNTLSTDYDNTQLIAENEAKVAAGGNAVWNNGTDISNTDYPLFRLADAYLMAAECQARGANVAIDGTDGYGLMNRVRARVGLTSIAVPTLSDILSERQKELYMEGHRRTDLIRFGLFTGGNYRWSWKGGQYEGIAIADYRALYPIPYQYEQTVGQNTGY